VGFEINTAGLRKACAELYPARDFLELASAAGVRLFINSDAHAPNELTAGFTEAVNAARAAGFTHTHRLIGRKPVAVPLP
jgi:histidinol-phosphatase (PHP family)